MKKWLGRRWQWGLLVTAIVGSLLLLWICAADWVVFNPVRPNKLAQSQVPVKRIAHQAYVWQRVWRAPLGAALQESAPHIQAWRVLAAHTDSQYQLQTMAVNVEMLLASQRPVLAVVRIDSALQHFQQQHIIEQILSLCRHWRAQGLPLRGLEIDYDSRVMDLAEYAQFLARLKLALQLAPANGAMASSAMASNTKAMPAQLIVPPSPNLDLLLSITALPSWLEVSELDAVLAQADQVVLQVHGVELGQHKIFDAVNARDWLRRFAARCKKPFWLALGNYSSLLHLDQDDQLLAVENEMPVQLTKAAAAGTGAGRSVEVRAKPEEIAAFLRSLPKLEQLQGIIWFRLPTSVDKRIWSLPTWYAAMQGRPLRQAWHVELRLHSAAGANSASVGFQEYQMILHNRGAIDADLPAQIRLNGHCSMRQLVGAYQVSALQIADQHELRLLRQQHGWLRAGEEMPVAKIQCQAEVWASALH